MEPWRRFDSAPASEARVLFEACCGSARWVDAMLARRPFGSREALVTAARDIWFALEPSDWREAFSHHPRIGDLTALRSRFETTRHLAAREQSGVSTASDEVLAALAEGNRRYEDTFGYTFIVCATGRSAEEMLALLTARLGNDPDTELRIAASEQAKITEIRLVG